MYYTIYCVMAASNAERTNFRTSWEWYKLKWLQSFGALVEMAVIHWEACPVNSSLC
jgi:hypothetical protein